MKIAFLTPEYPHPNFKQGSGGIGTSIKNLAWSLIERGHSVSIIVVGQLQDAEFTEQGISFYQLQNVHFKGLSWWLTAKKIERLINQLYDDNKIDLVESPDWLGLTSFVQPKQCPIVIRLNGSDTYFCHLDQRPVKFWNRFQEKRALQKANAHIAVSAFVAQKTNELFKTKIDFSIIPNGIDVTTFSHENITDNPNPIVLYFGTLIRKKGLLELPNIFNLVHQALPQTELWLVGKDAPDIKTNVASTWQLMQSLFSEQSIKQVRYLGSQPYQKMQAMIQQASVCVFPSFAEAFPVSWLEAMAMQKPIVASNIGWANEMITDGNEGYLVHPTYHQLYAERVVYLLQNKSIASQFGQQARKKVMTSFSNQIIAETSVNFYQNIINGTH